MTSAELLQKLEDRPGQCEEDLKSRSEQQEVSSQRDVGLGNVTERLRDRDVMSSLSAYVSKHAHDVLNREKQRKLDGCRDYVR